MKPFLVCHECSFFDSNTMDSYFDCPHVDDCALLGNSHISYFQDAIIDIAFVDDSSFDIKGCD